MPDLLHQVASAKMAFRRNPLAVYYGTYLWRTATADAWSFLLRKSRPAIGFANVIFIVITLLSYSVLGADTLVHYGLSALAGLAALGLVYGVLVAVHLLYLTPRKLLAGKQDQVEALRDTIRAKEKEITVLKRLVARKTVVRHEKEKRAAA